MCAIAPRLRGPRAADRSLRGEPGVVERWRVPGVFYILLHGGEPRSEAFRGRRQCFVAVRVSCGIYVRIFAPRSRERRDTLSSGSAPPAFLVGHPRASLSPLASPSPPHSPRSTWLVASRYALRAPLPHLVHCTRSLYTDTDHCTVHTVHHCGSRTLNNGGQPIFSQCEWGLLPNVCAGPTPLGGKTVRYCRL